MKNLLLTTLLLFAPLAAYAAPLRLCANPKTGAIIAKARCRGVDTPAGHEGIGGRLVLAKLNSSDVKRPMAQRCELSPCCHARLVYWDDPYPGSIGAYCDECGQDLRDYYESQCPTDYEVRQQLAGGGPHDLYLDSRRASWQWWRRLKVELLGWSVRRRLVRPPLPGGPVRFHVSARRSL